MAGRRSSLVSAPPLVLTCVMLLTAASAAQAPAPPPRTSQDSTPTFRSGVQYVDVDVTVVDRKGRPVRGLGRDDFEVYEDGVPQAVDSFRQVDIRLPPRRNRSGRRRGTSPVIPPTGASTSCCSTAPAVRRFSAPDSWPGVSSP